MAASVPSSTSAIVVCFNEEDRIEDCLKSLAWCDEIVVVDSFSTDKTPEICRRYTEKFFQREWAGYGDQKAYAHSLATMEWVLLVDSDERVSDELRREIAAALAGDKGGICRVRHSALGLLPRALVAARRVVSGL